MAQEVLLEKDLETGRQLIDLLKRQSFNFNHVFWLFREERERWQLVIVSPLVDQKGFMEIYKGLVENIRNASFVTEIRNLTLLSPNDKYSKGIDETLKKYPVGSDLHEKGIVLEGVYYDGVYIYRSRNENKQSYKI